MKQTFYQLLGVSPTATAEKIKTRYATLLSQYRSELAQGRQLNPDSLVSLRVAYSTLTDPDKRAAYDITLQDVIGSMAGNKQNTEYRHKSKAIETSEPQPDSSRSWLRTNFFVRAWRGNAKAWQVFLFLVVLPWLVYLIYLSRIGIRGIADFAFSKPLWISILWALSPFLIQLYGAICYWRCAFNLRWQPLGYVARIVSVLFGIYLIAPISFALYVAGGMYSGARHAAPIAYDNLSPDEALITAVERIDNKKVEELLRNGTNPNARNKRGMTALQIAAVRNNKDLIELLVVNGADVNAKSTFNGNSPLTDAAFWGSTETVKLLLAKKADVNSRSKDGKTPLIAAAYPGHRDAMEVLLKKGADINANDVNGNSALWMAIYGGQKPAIQILLENGADMNAKNKEGKIPLEWAESQNKTDIVALLRRYSR